jgi:membrane AbrB-like protein
MIAGGPWRGRWSRGYRPQMKVSAGWLILLASTSATAVALHLLRTPAPFVFAGIVGGLFCALSPTESPTIPGAWRHGAMAVVGVAGGSMVDSHVLETLVVNPGPVLLCVFATLAVSLVIGQLLRIHRSVNGATAAFASFAGGATTAVLLARDSHADESVVMTVQYLRVVLVLATVPALVATLFHPEAGGAADSIPHEASLPADLLFTTAIVGGSAVVVRWLSFNGSWLIVPMLGSAMLTITEVMPGATPPGIAVNVAYLVIGLGVGLLVTRGALGVIVRMLPTSLAQIVLTVAACAGLGMALASQADVSALDGYLAASPGGLPAVAAVAMSSGADVGFVLGVQVLRMVCANLTAPLISTYYRRKAAAEGSPPDDSQGAP